MNETNIQNYANIPNYFNSFFSCFRQIKNDDFENLLGTTFGFLPKSESFVRLEIINEFQIAPD